MSNLPGESSLKSIESGFASSKGRAHRRKTQKRRREKCRAVKEQASAKSETSWIFDLVVKLKKSWKHIHVELPDRFHDKLEKLAERISVLEKLQYSLKVQDNENQPCWEGLESEFSSLTALCSQLNRKFQHLHNAVTVDETDDRHLGAIDMANGLFNALDELDDLFSRLVSSETTVGNRKSSLKSVESEIANFNSRAVTEQAYAKSELIWISDLIEKLKKLRDHVGAEFPVLFHDELEKLIKRICVLEKLPNARIVDHKDIEKLFEGLESKFSSIMTSCDELDGMFQHLRDGPTLDERILYVDVDGDWSPSGFDFILLDRQLGAIEMARDLFHALDKLDDLFSKLVSSETTYRNGDKGLRGLDIENGKADYNQNRVPSSLPFQGKRLSTLLEDKANSVIDIEIHEILVEQLDIAMISQTPVVMLFYSKDSKLCKDYAPHFDDLPNQYCHFDGGIKFLKVGIKRASRELKVEAYPTVMVMKPFSYGLMVVGKLSIEETMIVPAFVKAVNMLIDDFLWEWYRFK